MILTGKIITIDSGTQFTDKCQRITIRVSEADSMFRDFRMRTIDGLFTLDEELTIEITRKQIGKPSVTAEIENKFYDAPPSDVWSDGSPVEEMPTRGELGSDYGA